MVGVSDALSYILFTNPISAKAGDVLNVCGIGSKTVESKMIPPEPLWKLAAACGPYVRLAGLSGAAAVVLGAYGSHKKYKDPELKLVFETANKYHFYHTLAMFGLVFAKAPMLTAALWISGSVMFCGSCYYYAFTGDKKFSRLTPFGGMCFIAGWVTLCF